MSWVRIMASCNRPLQACQTHKHPYSTPIVLILRIMSNAQGLTDETVKIASKNCIPLLSPCLSVGLQVLMWAQPYDNTQG